MVKLILAILLVVLAYKVFGWFRRWQSAQQLAAEPPPEPLGQGADLRQCPACDRYVATSANPACQRVDCPMKAV